MSSIAKMDLLLGKLEGTAATYLSDLGFRPQSYDDLKNVMEARFKDLKTPQMYRVALEQITQKPSEELTAFADRISECAEKGYPGDATLRLQCAVQAFFRGAKDREAARIVINGIKPKSVHEAAIAMFETRQNLNVGSLPSREVRAVQQEAPRNKEAPVRKQWTPQEKVAYYLSGIERSVYKLEKKTPDRNYQSRNDRPQQ